MRLEHNSLRIEVAPIFRRYREPENEAIESCAWLDCPIRLLFRRVKVLITCYHRHVERHFPTSSSPILPIGNTRDWKNYRNGSLQLAHNADPLPPRNHCTEGRGRNSSCFWRRPMWSWIPSCPFGPCIDTLCVVQCPSRHVPSDHGKIAKIHSQVLVELHVPWASNLLSAAQCRQGSGAGSDGALFNLESQIAGIRPRSERRIQVLLVVRRASIYFADQVLSNGCTLYIRKYPAYAQ